MDSLKPARGFCLLSGGLDSQLAVAVLQAQGAQVEGIAFDSPFFNIAPARRAAQALGIALRVVDFTDAITTLIRNPEHGLGANLNPCRDCHAAMIRQAGQMMDAAGADFVATGEVLNQRPLSQTRRALDLVARASGYAEVLVRPLSARLLPETRPEREGRLDRSRLLGLEGRNRKPQMTLAEHYGIRDYPAPAGGCRLTEPNYCRRLRDLMDHEGLDNRRQLELLRVGRHFRLPDRRKLIVGRHQADNAALEQASADTDLLLYARDVPGPTALAPEGAGVDTAASARMLQVLCAYADRDGNRPIQCVLRCEGQETIRSEPTERLTRAMIGEWLV